MECFKVWRLSSIEAAAAGAERRRVRERSDAASVKGRLPAGRVILIAQARNRLR